MTPIVAEGVIDDAPRFDSDPALTDFAPQPVALEDVLASFAEMSSRLKKLEGAVWPEPDFDSGWEPLDAHSAIDYKPDEPRAVSRFDVMRKTGEDEFELLPTSRREGPVWARPTPGTDESRLTQCTIYNTLDSIVVVRVQGWYA